MKKAFLPLALAACFSVHAEQNYYLVSPLTAEAVLSPGSFGLSTLSLNYPEVVVGRSSSATIEITNTGVRDQSFTELRVTENTAEFSVVDDCPDVLSSGASCTATVTYLPVADTAPGQLTVAMDPAGTKIVPLMGTSAYDVLRGSAQKDMGTLIVGQSTSATYVLTNAGTATTALAYSALPTGVVRSGDCGSVIAANTSCSLTLTWTPATAGSLAATLRITGDHSSVDFGVTGLAITPAALASVGSTTQSAGNVFVGESGTTTWTLSNSGQAAAPLSYGTLPADMVKSGTCGATLAGGASCTVILTWTPSAAGALNATYTAGGLSLKQTGTAVAKTYLGAVSTAGLAFGSKDTGTSASQSVTLTNTGNQPLTLPANVGTGVGAPYSVADNCGTTLAVGASCTTTVVYTPTAAGTYNQTLTIGMGSAGSKTVALSGSAVSPIASVTGYSIQNDEDVSVSGDGSEVTRYFNKVFFTFSKSVALTSVTLNSYSNPGGYGYVNAYWISGSQVNLSGSLTNGSVNLTLHFNDGTSIVTTVSGVTISTYSVQLW